MILADWILGDIIGVFALFLGISFFLRARAANKSGIKWGLGMLVGFLVVSWVAVVLVRMIFAGLGTPFYGQIAAQLIAAWIIVTVVGGVVCDRLAESHLAR